MISVIITTYNHPRELMLVLDALAHQSDHDFEVIVADDGSDVMTSQMLKDFSKKAPYPIRHVWQEDKGFRAAQIRNKAVSYATGDYLIFIDGDSVPLKSFIKNHRALAEKGYFVAGNRVLLGKNFTERVLNQNLNICSWSKMHWLWARISGNCNKFLAFFFLPGTFWRKYKSKSWRGVKTCNLGISREDFLVVNGFDERYQGWGYEDSDLAIRLIRKGVLRKLGSFATAVLHLWHKEYDRTLAEQNWQRLKLISTNNEVRAEKGMEQYLGSRKR